MNSISSRYASALIMIENNRNCSINQQIVGLSKNKIKSINCWCMTRNLLGYLLCCSLAITVLISLGVMIIEISVLQLSGASPELVNKLIPDQVKRQMGLNLHLAVS